jgi:4-hydroxybenzoyl-CoA thioesterase
MSPAEHRSFAVPSSEARVTLPADTRTVTTDDGLAVCHSVTVEWGDCDAAGIIFYPTYFKWWDQGTWRLFWAVGLDKSVMREAMGGAEMPIMNVGATFERPLIPGDQPMVESRVERWGNSSFRIAHRVVLTDGATVAHGHETRCWVANDPATPGKMKAMRIPDDVIARFGGTRA